MQLEAKDNFIESGSKLIYGLVLAAALSLGCWGCMLSMFRLSLPFAAVLAAVAILPCVFVMLGRIPGIGRFMAFYILLISAAFILIFYQNVFDGFLQILNRAVTRLNVQLDTGYLDFRTYGGTGNVWMAFLPAVIVVSAGIGQSVAQRRPLLGFALTAAVVGAGLVFKATPSIWMLLLLTLSWAALFLLSSGAGRLPVIGAGLILMIILSLLFTDAAWQPIKSLDTAKARFVAWEEDLRYGGDDIDSLSRGDLTRTHPLKYDDQAVFSLQMQMGQSLYLRGFAGADYADQKWSEADDTIYSGDYRGVIQWLEGKGYYPWCQENSIYRLLPDYTFTEVTIDNRRASSKYIWLPYETAVAGDAKSDNIKYDQDRAPLAGGLRGQREYTIKIFDSALKEYTDAQGAQLIRSISKQDRFASYLEKEKIYRTFVYDHYMDVDGDTAGLLSNLDIEKCEGKTLDYCLYILRDKFTKEFTYDTDTKAAPEGRDALEYFLTESKKGNCMHFATAAALFLRQAGFPARYAEGYYLSPEQLELYEDLQNVKMPIADSDSHAWVEVYVDQLGWIPVEVTPGFYDMTKQRSEEKEETEKLNSVEQETYPDELEIDDAPSQSPLAESNMTWLLIAAAIIAALAAYYGIRRWLLARPKDIYGMYNYLCRLMAFDGINIKDDPYRSLKEVSDRYDVYTGNISYETVLRMLYQDRYSDEKLTIEQIAELDTYSRDVAIAVYERQPWYRKIWMRFIRVLY